jgi:hypothetical protein
MLKKGSSQRDLVSGKRHYAIHFHRIGKVNTLIKEKLIYNKRKGLDVCSDAPAVRKSLSQTQEVIPSYVLTVGTK